MNDENRKAVLNRLKSIEGHIRGIERMVEEDAYCIDVVKQVMAVEKAIDKVNTLIMQSHLNECVIAAIRGNDARKRQKVIGEIVEVFELSGKI